MRNFFVPQSTQVDRVAARPFFMVTASMSLEAVLAQGNRVLIRNRQNECASK